MFEVTFDDTRNVERLVRFMDRSAAEHFFDMLPLSSAAVLYQRSIGRRDRVEIYAK